MRKASLPKSTIKSFLQENNFYPFTLWNVFDITHTTSAPTKVEKRQIKQYIAQKVGDRPGLYAYMDKNGHLLYVGKAKKLVSRIFSHYNEAYYTPKETDRSVAWPDFFSKHAGELKVHWIELDGDREQRIIEEMIECWPGTQFDRDYPRRHRNKKPKR